MKRFIQGEHRGQTTLFPESLDDYVSDTNPVRVADVFVDELDLINLDFESAVPSTAISTVSSQANASSARRRATSS
ncbi:hypothetical protein BK653_14325 [Pseudomonas brassicacearum]|nr:hypothetical protein BK653_14325 [Pseudomonas brassicacearum]